MKTDNDNPVSEQTTTLKSIWTKVGDLTLYAQASAIPIERAQKPIFVLVHGLLISSRYMRPTAELLAKQHRVFVPDLPGFGRSDNPDHVFSLTELADTLIAWMDALNLPSAVFIGNSLGSQMLVDLAIRYPARVEHLVLTDPTVDPYARRMLWQFIRLVMDGPLENPTLAFPLLIDVFAGGPYRAWQTFRYALADPIQQKLTQVQAPTLVVRGEHDPVVSQRWVEEATALLPDGQLVVIPDAPHCPNFSTPDELVRVVRAFLERKRSKGQGTRNKGFDDGVA